MFDALTAGNGVGSGTQPKDAVGKGNDELGQDDFLKLMITQFQNQDPFQPMESGEFLGQLAHFTSANGITELQKSFDKFAASMTTDQGLRAASLVGRDVLVESNRGALREGESMGGAVKNLSGVDNVTVRIENAAGELVRELPLGAASGSQASFNWDGTNNRGVRMPPGEYRISAQGTRNGESISLGVLSGARVNSVTLGQGGQSPMLSLDGVGDKPLSDVRQIQ
ncbi:flagellar basal-body rod modification protein FlgD [Natronocella acetinitrilica]|uniref:Basal-body rod modification protein FlgD n=1 Tax=Natronocella acetinitrilica TaxID=414046 RepID=A0AAE3KGU5_9GAMM|nr:flagellar hook assembly protein FlgD [Natronocella acetinitrilica]MCP1675622.1 flagellar basal-body rod modification protein FlgD [Natronocella acetinitrilica]